MDFYTSEQLSKLQEEVSEGTVISNQQQPPNQAELFLVSLKKSIFMDSKGETLIQKGCTLSQISGFHGYVFMA